MPYTVEPKKCASGNCPNSFTPDRWGNIKSHATGWFHQRNGNSWCPEHSPAWVSEWRMYSAIIKEEIHQRYIK